MNINEKYFKLLLDNKDKEQKLNPIRDNKNNSPLIPYSICDDEEAGEFPINQYEDLEMRLDALENVHFKIIKMHGGLGSSVKRDDLVEGELSAKGVDLKIKVEGKLKSIAELHLDAFNALKAREIYGQVSFQNLVNDDTRDDVQEISSKYDVLPPIEQQKMPTLNEKGELTEERLAPAGHGFIGVHEILDAIQNPSRQIVSIGNGEDLNSTVDAKMLSYVADKNIPLTMITTDKTEADLKGGQLAIVKNDHSYLAIIEKAQAEELKQLDYFQELGLREGDRKALFNTNIVIINKGAIHQLVNEYLGDVDVDKFLNSIAPDVIKNVKEQDGKKFTQLESALGSVLLNFDRYFRENFDTKTLEIINLNKKDRKRFFLPIKKREDYDAILRDFEYDSSSLKLVEKD